MVTVTSSDGEHSHVQLIRDCTSCEEIRIANRTIYLIFPKTVLRLAPSSGNQFFYLIVERRPQNPESAIDTGEKMWPRAEDEAIAAWYAKVCGFSTLVKKTPDGERHLSLS